MKAYEIKVGNEYIARVGRYKTVVRVDSIDSVELFRRKRTLYYCTNLRTNRKVCFRSAMKFQRPVENDAHKSFYLSVQ